MLRLCLQKALRPAVQKLPGLKQAPPTVPIAPRLPGVGRHTPSCWMGTHGRNEPREPLNSPKRAKEFIYRLHPNERTCLLKELQSFESMAIAQGKKETAGSITELWDWMRSHRLSPATVSSMFRPLMVDMHVSADANCYPKGELSQGVTLTSYLKSGGDALL